ncbi:DNA oxidative demethylase ALKBH2 [Purpureocillium lavendulum]|uniref:DNA oxidative demethylase ALKBH2 n=1 Tax=Purpureocillium lavendulum TaxID=1247861 RepID=A0AB34G1Y7_9HYPO|nr:DNA oxidative demethylase ALKBH2 [Purpureocillium lavendulum]
MDFDDGDIEDRDVLRGLHVAASAACDEEVDAFVRNRTGLRIRRFLADLMALEAFGDPRPGEDSRQRARRRRADMRKLKQQNFSRGASTTAADDEELFLEHSVATL